MKGKTMEALSYSDLSYLDAHNADLFLPVEASGDELMQTAPINTPSVGDLWHAPKVFVPTNLRDKARYAVERAIRDSH